MAPASMGTSKAVPERATWQQRERQSTSKLLKKQLLGSDEELCSNGQQELSSTSLIRCETVGKRAGLGGERSLGPEVRSGVSRWQFEVRAFRSGNRAGR